MSSTLKIPSLAVTTQFPEQDMLNTNKESFRNLYEKALEILGLTAGTSHLAALDTKTYPLLNVSIHQQGIKNTTDVYSAIAEPMANCLSELRLLASQTERLIIAFSDVRSGETRWAEESQRDLQRIDLHKYCQDALPDLKDTLANLTNLIHRFELVREKDFCSYEKSMAMFLALPIDSSTAAEEELRELSLSDTSHNSTIDSDFPKMCHTAEEASINDITETFDDFYDYGKALLATAAAMNAQIRFDFSRFPKLITEDNKAIIKGNYHNYLALQEKVTSYNHQLKNYQAQINRTIDLLSKLLTDGKSSFQQQETTLKTQEFAKRHLPCMKDHCTQITCLLERFDLLMDTDLGKNYNDSMTRLSSKLLPASSYFSMGLSMLGLSATKDSETIGIMEPRDSTNSEVYKLEEKFTEHFSEMVKKKITE